MASRTDITPEVVAAIETLRSAGFLFASPRHLRLVSVRAAGAMLSVSASTVRLWQRQGRFPGATMLPGGDLRIPVQDIEALASAGRLLRRREEVAA